MPFGQQTSHFLFSQLTVCYDVECPHGSFNACAIAGDASSRSEVNCSISTRGGDIYVCFTKNADFLGCVLPTQLHNWKLSKPKGSTRWVIDGACRDDVGPVLVDNVKQMPLGPIPMFEAADAVEI